MKTDTTETHRPEFTLIPAGFVVGAGLGAYLGQSAWGVSLGIILGATASMIADYQNGKRSIAWPIVGGAAALWTFGVLLIERI